jgi:hypothetical protein
MSLFLLAFLAARRWMVCGGRRWWLAATCLWTLALLAKETAHVGLVPSATTGWCLTAMSRRGAGG